jgi:hypothetical protein
LGLLSTIGDFVRLDGNPKLARVDLPDLLTIGSLLATNNNSLATISAPSLAFATLDVQLINLPALTAIELDQLTSIGNDFTLGGLPVLASLPGLARLQSIGGDFVVTGTGSLGDFTGLGALDGVSGSMTITSNAQLRSFTGLTRMAEVGGDLTVTGNPLLPRATSQAFAQRITVRGTVTIN